MSHSTHAGFRGGGVDSPVSSNRLICSLSGLEFLACVASEAAPDFQSLAVGVAYRLTAVDSPSPALRLAPLRLWFPLTVGVGHDEDSVPEVRGANGRSRNARPLRVIPERGQFPEYAIKPPNKQAWRVLHEHVAGS